MIEDELLEILKDHFDCEISEINSSTNLHDLLDSLDRLDLLLTVRKKYKIEIAPHEIQNLKTIEQIAREVKKLQNMKLVQK